MRPDIRRRNVGLRRGCLTLSVLNRDAQPGDSALELNIPVFIYLLLLAAAVAFWWMGSLIPGDLAQQDARADRPVSSGLSRAVG
jgi:hypothetical protein